MFCRIHCKIGSDERLERKKINERKERIERKHSRKYGYFNLDTLLSLKKIIS